MECIHKFGCEISGCCFACKKKCNNPCLNNPATCNSVKSKIIKPLLSDEERHDRHIEAMKKYAKNK